MTIEERYCISSEDLKNFPRIDVLSEAKIQLFWPHFKAGHCGLD